MPVTEASFSSVNPSLATLLNSVAAQVAAVASMPIDEIRPLLADLRSKQLSLAEASSWIAQFEKQGQPPATVSNYRSEMNTANANFRALHTAVRNRWNTLAGTGNHFGGGMV